MSTDALRDRLGHAFQRPELLLQALTHRSYGATHNERLEFVGDAVLNCVIAAALYARFPAMPEGELSRIRAHLVNRVTLARVARRLDLGTVLRLGEVELRSGGAARPSLLADALEAVAGHTAPLEQKLVTINGALSALSGGLATADQHLGRAARAFGL